MKPKTRKELAVEYGINRRTLHRWFEQKGITIDRGLIKTKDLEYIYETFGIPDKKK